jgi:anti-sigma regulatory factor (Ser/Thr protein kinase)
MTERLPANQSSSDIWRLEETTQGLHVEVHFFPADSETPTGPEHINRIHKLARKVLEGWGFDPDRVADVVLVTAELTNNGNEHGTGVQEVAFTYDPDTLRVQVVNGLQAEAVSVDVPGHDRDLMSDEENEQAEDGRGVYITAALADAWDVQIDPDMGKVVAYADFQHLQRRGDDPLPPMGKAA